MNKQIEEIKRTLEIAMCQDLPFIDSCELGAKALYNQGYRNCKDKVVLTKEDYESKLKKIKRYEGEREYISKTMLDNTRKFAELTIDFENMLDDVYELAAKETAREFAQTLISLFWEEEEGEMIRRKDVQGVIRDVLRASYKVEVE